MTTYALPLGPSDTRPHADQVQSSERIQGMSSVWHRLDRLERENDALWRIVRRIAATDRFILSELDEIEREIHVQFPSNILAVVTATNGEPDMSNTISFTFAFPGGTSTIDSLHQIGSPTYTFTQSSGDGTLTDNGDGTATVTGGAVDDVIAWTIENVAFDANGGVQSFSGSVDLADQTAPATQFPSGVTAVVTANP